MKFETLGTRILVQLQTTENVTEGGIVIPETVNVEEPNEGVVVSVGDEVKNVSAGDRILFEKHTATPIAIEGKNLCVVNLQYVIGAFR